MKYLAVGVAGLIGGLCLSPTEPLPQCYEELVVMTEPGRVRCAPGARLEIDGPVVTCRCFQRGETRLVNAE